MPTRIEWCDETINPLGHGCYGPGGTKGSPLVCEYCYAAKMAKRNMRGCEICKQFVPHQHFEQLEKLAKWKKPRTIFVQSMGDMFHDAILDEWIKAVFEACANAPQHRYLFLTKNPKRYLELYENKGFPYGKNCWFGATVTGPDDPFHWFRDTPYHSFISIEPLLASMGNYEGEHWPEWVIIGAETGNRKNKVIPERGWIKEIAAQCREWRIPVFMKRSLADIWGEPLIQECPW